MNHVDNGPTNGMRTETYNMRIVCMCLYTLCLCPSVWLAMSVNDTYNRTLKYTDRNMNANVMDEFFFSGKVNIARRDASIYMELVYV